MRISIACHAAVLLLAFGLSACGDMATDDGATYPSPSPTTGYPEQPSGDKYDAVGTNPFVVTAHDPLSTFAVDVDTASYDIFRRDIELGTLPNPDSVRLEEYVNYFPYSYTPPSADSDVPFSITLRAALNPHGNTTLMAVGIKGKEIPWSKRPANLVFLVDVSGSMSASNKLPLLKKMLLEALDVLDPEDTLSLVTYAGNTSVRLTPTPVSDRATIEAAISGLSSGGSTAGAAGITLAYQQAKAGFIEGGINHVLLCTDGDFNVGASSTDALVQLIEEKRKTGITLTVLGFGYGNLNDAMMEAITNAGNGIYSVISSEDQAISYVHKRLLQTFNQIAKDVKIQVELNPEKVLAYRLLGYENRALADDQFKDDRVDAGEVGSGHTVTALYELVLVGDTIPTPEGAPAPLDGEATDHVCEVPSAELARVRVRYKAPDASEEDPASQVEQGLTPAQAAGKLEHAPGDLQWAAAIATFAEIVKQSPFARPESLDTLTGIVSAQAGTDADRLEFVGLLSKARGLLGK